MHCREHTAVTAGDKLLEACYLGDLNAVKELIENGVDVNFVNKVNKWTALHWAVSKSNLPLVQYLVSKGASKDLVNNKGEKPMDVSTSRNIDSILSPGDRVERNGVRKSEFCKESIQEKHGFVPNFIEYPPIVPSSRDMRPLSETERDKSREICIRARVSEGEERDFIELDIDLDACSFEDLTSVLCKELKIDIQVLTVRKVRKLPNTIVRNDRDVQRLIEGSAVELVLRDRTVS